VKKESLLKPFKGLRPALRYVDEVVFTFDNLKALNACFSQNSSKISQKWHIQRKGKSKIDLLLKNQILVQDNFDSIYIYRIKKGSHQQTGIISLVNIKAYAENRILGHEGTLSSFNNKATNFFNDTFQANPVMLTLGMKISTKDLISSLVAGPPDCMFVNEDSVEHFLWQIQDQKQIESILFEFSTVDRFYIADGHHRIQAANKMQTMAVGKNLGYFLAAIFPHEELNISPYNRIIYDIKSFEPEKILSKASDYFEIEILDEPVFPVTKKIFNVFLGTRWYKMKPLENIDLAISDTMLDSSLFDEIFKNIFNNQKDYCTEFFSNDSDIKLIEKRIIELENALAVFFSGMPIEEILQTADEGRLLPPKSTFFEPKLAHWMVAYSP
jgi:uncharacterized protein (DUF1015 family)